MMKPVNNSHYETEWATDVITATESSLTAGTDFEASLYDDEGNPLYTATDKRVMDIPLVLEKKRFSEVLPLLPFRHTSVRRGLRPF